MVNGNYSKQILYFGVDPNKLPDLSIGNSGHLHHNFEISEKRFYCLVIL